MRSRIDVVGGVYREQCRLPTPTDEIWGSGGRAAAVVAGLGITVTLHTAVTAATEVVLASLAHTFHFDVATAITNETLQFQYEHALSTPVISPQRLGNLTIQFDAENVLAFGMLEAKAIIRAQRVVYDPQNPVAPEPIEFPPGVTPRVAYVLNSWEARKLGGVDDLAEAASRITNRFRAAVVVIKRGPRGALVYENGRSERIPAYKTDSVWPIGSGDVFAAAFASRWAGEERPAVEAAGDASRAAAIYVNSRVLPISSDEIKEGGRFNFPPLLMGEHAAEASGYDVYLAGPFFNIAQRWLIEEARAALQGMGLKVFSPLHDIGLGGAHDVAPQDLEGLKKSRAVLALVDGLDAGTMFEIGYARSVEKPVVVLAESTGEEPLKMVSGSGCDIATDFVTAVHRAAWAALA
jgi:nucleoside 2-deoxyribosyltransferase